MVLGVWGAHPAKTVFVDDTISDTSVAATQDLAQDGTFRNGKGFCSARITCVWTGEMAQW